MFAEFRGRAPVRPPLNTPLNGFFTYFVIAKNWFKSERLEHSMSVESRYVRKMCQTL